MKKKTGSASLGYLTKEGFRNLRVNKLLSFASITVLFSCMFLMGTAFLVFININDVVSHVESENVIMVYVQDGAVPADLTNLEAQIKADPNVDTCTFVSKDDAYDAILKDYGESGEYLRDLNENPLPDAYTVTVKDMGQFSKTVKRIEKLDNVMRIRKNSDLADKLSMAEKAIFYVSLAIIGLLFIVSLFIISNTVKMTMFSRRLEISIMKSVGATNRFIRWPFMVEGILIGIISAVISTAVIWGLYTLALRYFRTIGLFTDIGAGTDIVPYLPYMLGAFLCLGIFTGIFGSANSIRRYLKERKFVELEDL